MHVYCISRRFFSGSITLGIEITVVFAIGEQFLISFPIKPIVEKKFIFEFPLLDSR